MNASNFNDILDYRINMLSLTNIKLINFGQFQDINNIRLKTNEKIIIVVGPIATGKTTVLNLIYWIITNKENFRHYESDFPFLNIKAYHNNEKASEIDCGGVLTFNIISERITHELTISRINTYGINSKKPYLKVQKLEITLDNEILPKGIFDTLLEKLFTKNFQNYFLFESGNRNFEEILALLNELPDKIKHQTFVNQLIKDYNLFSFPIRIDIEEKSIVITSNRNNQDFILDVPAFSQGEKVLLEWILLFTFYYSSNNFIPLFLDSYFGRLSLSAREKIIKLINLLKINFQLILFMTPVEYSLSHLFNHFYYRDLTSHLNVVEDEIILKNHDLTQITVRGLFNELDYEIPLNNQSRLTLIFGPNGSGKTTILNSLYLLIKNDFDQLRKYDLFNEFDLNFNDKIVINYNSEYPNDQEEFYRLKNLFVVKINSQRINDIESLTENLKNKLILSDDSDDDLTTLDSIAIVQKVLNSIVEQKNNEFDEEKRKIDSEFPKKLILNETEPSLQVFRRDLDEINKKFINLVNLGLLPITVSESFTIIGELVKTDDTIIEKHLNYFSLFISEYKNLLSIFDDLADRMGLFFSILTDFFDNKTIKIVLKKGLEFSNKRGNKINIDFLSDGEKNVIIMFFFLIFLGEPDTLFLIDEPENSLHIRWQRQILDILLKIGEKFDYYYIIATHSPIISSKYSELCINLGDDE